MSVKIAGKIKLNDQEFFFLKGQYRKSRLPSVIPRISSGDLGLSDLSAWNWWGQSIWDGGFQQKISINRAKFLISSNIDHLSTKGQIQLSRDRNLVKTFDSGDTFNDPSEGNPTEIYDGQFWAGLANSSVAKVFKSSDASSFTAITTGWTDVTAVKQMAVFKDKLFMACNTDGVDECLQSWDNNATSMNGVSDFGRTNCRSVGVARGKIYAAEFTSFSAGDTIRESATGDDGDWTDIYETGGGFQCNQILEFSNKAYFLFQNSSDFRVELWVYDGVDTVFVARFDSLQIANLKVYKNILYISGVGPDGVEIWAFNEATLIPVFKENDEVNPRIIYRFPTTYKQRLYYGNLVTEDGFNFVQQHDLNGSVSGAVGAGTLLIPLQSFNSVLLFQGIGVDDASKDGIFITDNSNYVVSGSLQSSKIDMDLFGVDKLFGGITIYHDPIPTGGSIEVKIRIDSTTAFSGLSVVGTNSTVGSTSFDIEFLSNNVGKKIEYEVTLKTSTTANTPRVQDIVIRYILLPVSKRVWDISILAVDNIKEYNKPKSGQEIENALWKLSQGGIISFVDRQGDVYDNKKDGTEDRGVIFDDIRTEVLNYDQGEGVVKVRLIEG